VTQSLAYRVILNIIHQKMVVTITTQARADTYYTTYEINEENNNTVYDKLYRLTYRRSS